MLRIRKEKKMYLEQCLTMLAIIIEVSLVGVVSWWACLRSQDYSGQRQPLVLERLIEARKFLRNTKTTTDALVFWLKTLGPPEKGKRLRTVPALLILEFLEHMAAYAATQNLQISQCRHLSRNIPNYMGNPTKLNK